MKNIKNIFILTVGLLILSGCTIRHEILNERPKNRMFADSDQYYETDKYLISKQTIIGKDGKEYNLVLDKEKFKKLLKESMEDK